MENFFNHLLAACNNVIDFKAFSYFGISFVFGAILSAVLGQSHDSSAFRKFRNYLKGIICLVIISLIYGFAQAHSDIIHVSMGLVVGSLIVGCLYRMKITELLVFITNYIISVPVWTAQTKKMRQEIYNDADKNISNPLDPPIENEKVNHRKRHGGSKKNGKKRGRKK